MTFHDFFNLAYNAIIRENSTLHVNFTTKLNMGLTLILIEIFKSCVCSWNLARLWPLHFLKWKINVFLNSFHSPASSLSDLAVVLCQLPKMQFNIVGLFKKKWRQVTLVWSQCILGLSVSWWMMMLLEWQTACPDGAKSWWHHPLSVRQEDLPHFPGHCPVYPPETLWEAVVIFLIIWNPPSSLSSLGENKQQAYPKAYLFYVEHLLLGLCLPLSQLGVTLLVHSIIEVVLQLHL